MTDYLAEVTEAELVAARIRDLGISCEVERRGGIGHPRVSLTPAQAGKLTRKAELWREHVRWQQS